MKLSKSVEWRTCKSKHRYPTYNAALKGVKKYSKENGRQLDTYECPFCHGWHLTHSIN